LLKQPTPEAKPGNPESLLLICKPVESGATIVKK
jgi:hypothetical protein